MTGFHYVWLFGSFVFMKQGNDRLSKITLAIGTLTLIIELVVSGNL